MSMEKYTKKEGYLPPLEKTLKKKKNSSLVRGHMATASSCYSSLQRPPKRRYNRDQRKQVSQPDRQESCTKTSGASTDPIAYS